MMSFISRSSCVTAMPRDSQNRMASRVTKPCSAKITMDGSDEAPKTSRAMSVDSSESSVVCMSPMIRQMSTDDYGPVSVSVVSVTELRQACYLCTAKGRQLTV